MTKKKQIKTITQTSKSWIIPIILINHTYDEEVCK